MMTSSGQSRAPADALVYSSSPPSQTSGFHTSRPSLDVPGSAASSASVDHLSYLLLKGDKKEAVRYAMDEKLWSHALIVSSCLDKQTWGNVVKAFAAAELSDSASSDKSRHAMRLTYEMFSGANGPFSLL